MNPETKQWAIDAVVELERAADAKLCDKYRERAELRRTLEAVKLECEALETRLSVLQDVREHLQASFIETIIPFSEDLDLAEAIETRATLVDLPQVGGMPIVTLPAATPEPVKHTHICEFCAQEFTPKDPKKPSKYCCLTCSGKGQQRKMVEARAAQKAPTPPAPKPQAHFNEHPPLGSPKTMPPVIDCPFAVGDKVRVLRGATTLSGAPMGGVVAVVLSIRPDGVPVVQIGNGKYSIKAENLEAA